MKPGGPTGQTPDSKSAVTSATAERAVLDSQMEIDDNDVNRRWRRKMTPRRRGMSSVGSPKAIDGRESRYERGFGRCVIFGRRSKRGRGLDDGMAAASRSNQTCRRLRLMIRGLAAARRVILRLAATASRLGA